MAAQSLRAYFRSHRDQPQLAEKCRLQKKTAQKRPSLWDEKKKKFLATKQHTTATNNAGNSKHQMRPADQPTTMTTRVQRCIFTLNPVLQSASSGSGNNLASPQRRGREQSPTQPLPADLFNRFSRTLPAAFRAQAHSKRSGILCEGKEKPGSL